MAEEKARLYLIDASHLIFRAYHAIRGLSTADGLVTNAVFGFTSALHKLMRERRPDYVAAVFDLSLIHI